MKTTLFYRLLITLWILPFAALALDTADEDYYRVLMIEGTDIPTAIGKPTSNLSLLAVIDGQLEPIPYQIDEYNKGGAVYIENWDEPIAGSKAIMDSTDRLLFLLGDSGERKNAQAIIDGSLLAEIELETQKGNLRYVYLVENSRLRSDAQHVRFSSEESQVETDFYSMIFDKSNQLIWKDFTYADYTGSSPIDGMKIQFETGVLGNVINMSFDNENFVARTIGEHVGPIRTTTQLHLEFIYLGIKFIDTSIQLHFYPNAIIYDTRLIIPEFRRSLIANPKMTLSVDYNDLQGAKVITDFSPVPLLVDGQLSDKEKAVINTTIRPQESGLLIKSLRGFDVLSFMDWLDGNTVPTAFYYRDNLDHQGTMDRFKGQQPDLGYRVSDMPHNGLFGFVASIYFSDSYQGTPKELSQKVRTSPVIKVNSAH